MSKHYLYGNYHQAGYVLPEDVDKKFYDEVLTSNARMQDVITCGIKLFMKTADEMGIDYKALINWMEDK